MVKTNSDTNIKVALPGLAALVEQKSREAAKSDRNNNKTEHVAADALQNSVFESSKELKNLQTITEKGDKDTIFYNKNKDRFWVEKKKSGFVEFLKAIFFVNFFRCTLAGYLSNENTVHYGFDKAVTDLISLRGMTATDEENKKLMDTAKSVKSVFEKIKNQCKQGSMKASATNDLVTRITTFLGSNAPAQLFPTPVLGARPPAQQQLIPPEGQPLNLGQLEQHARVPQHINHVQEVNHEQAKPKLPALDTYKIPEIEIGANLGEYQLAQTKHQKRHDLLTNLNEYYQEFIEARNELVGKYEEREAIAARLQPQQPQVNVTGNDGPPPPPPPPSTNGGPPPAPIPPPPANSKNNQGSRPKLQRQPTWRDRLAAKLKDVKLEDHVELVSEINELEAKRDRAIEVIKETLFPGIEGLSFSSEEEVETLEQYVVAYQNQAEEQQERLSEDIARLDPRNRRGNSPNRLSRSDSVDQPQESQKVRKLRNMVQEIQRFTQRISANEQKVEHDELDKQKAIDEQNKLAKEILLKSEAAKQQPDSYPTADRQREAHELKVLQEKASGKDQDIARAKENIERLENRIESSKKTLAIEVHMPQDSDLGDIIAKANEVIADESQK